MKCSNEIRCCCNCKYQTPIHAHPWNKNEFTKGPCSKIIGYGCTVFEEGITFIEAKHGRCECHEFKEIRE